MHRGVVGSLALTAVCACGGDAESTPPPVDCAPGQELHGGICGPMLPTLSCPYGTMAMAGAAGCGDVMSCDDPSWEAMASAPDTIHVRADYTGAEQTGSREQPFVTVGAALSAAPAGASIAIDDGQYTESVSIGRAVRLFGRCPAHVALTSGSDNAITVAAAAGGTEVRGLGLTSGVRALGTADITMGQLWIHDTAGSAIVAEAGAHARLEHSLIERVARSAVVAIGSSVEVADSTLRDVGSSDMPASGVTAHATEPNQARPQIVLRASLIERVAGFGVLVLGGDASAERSVVREVTSGPEQKFGDGIAVMSFSFLPPTVPSHVEVRESWIRNNSRAGIAGFGATISLYGVVLDCNVIDLAAEPAPLDAAVPSELTNLGGNACGCAPRPDDCQARSANLEPPLPL